MARRFYQTASKIVVSPNADLSAVEFASKIPKYEDKDSTRFYWHIHEVTTASITVDLAPFATVRASWIWNLSASVAGTLTYRTPASAVTQINDIMPGQIVSLGQLTVADDLILDAASGTIDMGVFLSGT